MHIYRVPKGVKCKIIVQVPNEDIQVKDDYVTKNDCEFGDEQLIIDYVRYMNEKMKPDSVATKLASKGYYIFCDENQNDKYLLAVPAPSVKVL